MGRDENPTRFKAIKHDNINEKQNDNYFHKNDIPQYVHYEFYEEKENRGRENTDPYIFGDTFYYCCCKQTSRKTGKPKYLQTDLAKGSLILFGCKLKDKFLLDTVFVVKDVIQYFTCSTDNLYFGKVLADLSRTYVNTSLKPLEKSEAVGGEKFSFYIAVQLRIQNTVLVVRKYIAFFLANQLIEPRIFRTDKSKSVFLDRI